MSIRNFLFLKRSCQSRFGKFTKISRQLSNQTVAQACLYLTVLLCNSSVMGFKSLRFCLAESVAKYLRLH